MEIKFCIKSFQWLANALERRHAVLIYYIVLLHCTWPQLETAPRHRTVKAMLLADVHLLGPRFGHWFDKLRREWQMYRTFQTAMTLHNPEVVFILGDIFDEGHHCSETEFNNYVKRFHNVFSVPDNTKLYVVIGNHDIGFHYGITPQLKERFEKSFNVSSVEMLSIHGNIFVLVNSMAMHGDKCFLCKPAEDKLKLIAQKLKCSKDPSADKSCKRFKSLPSYSRPIFLQHFPLYRPSDSQCKEPDAAPPDIINEPFREFWDCLSRGSSNLVLDSIEPRAVFTGHTHHGCLTMHRDNIPEWTLPSFSWRNKNDPSFVLAAFAPDTFKVSKCYMPKENTENEDKIEITEIFVFCYLGFDAKLISRLNTRKQSTMSSPESKQSQSSPDSQLGEFKNPPEPQPNRKPTSFLSSVFNSRKSFSGKNLFASNDGKQWTNEKGQGFFSSVFTSNQTILTDLSSKLEAALSLSFDSGESSDETSGKTSRNSAINETSNNSSQAGIRRHSTGTSVPLTKAEQIARQHRYTKKRGTRHKDRSVYGQPEIEPFDMKQKTWKDHSQESLDTVDSGQSLENCSSLSASGTDSRLAKNDPLYVFRHPSSIGIGSESDICGHSTSLDSSDAESIPEGHGFGYGRTGSGSSLHSWASSPSNDSQPDDITLESMEFMRHFVQRIFSDSSSINFEEKAKFGELCRHEIGRLWFGRCVNAQRVHNKLVKESTFYSLVQYFAIVLFECAEADDFSPAKSIMNMCFTFYYECKQDGRAPSREYLFSYLTDQPIWRSVRFWNAAFFDAVQCERANRQIPTRDELGEYSADDLRDEKNFQENIFFGQLGTFTYNMYAFGLSKQFAMEFLQKQCTIASLSKEHVLLLIENIDRMYSGEIGKECS
ncbi:hypothetical protein JTE90_019848 [Oedothorax gibbosus]|uniref:Calcineurin-like phosphoesterase domain-containing protein n=1 Tax=Oedothorax gibbosus TaxID=931172 RepID=A0AAV6VWQ0_9ARAC|nr:hypothetical protein JTE90_019848 [Oedothorax gibbosus]